MFDYRNNWFYYGEEYKNYSYEELKQDFLQNGTDGEFETFEEFLDYATDFGGDLIMCSTKEKALEILHYWTDEEESEEA